jgi:hypothetical protein
MADLASRNMLQRIIKDLINMSFVSIRRHSFSGLIEICLTTVRRRFCLLTQILQEHFLWGTLVVFIQFNEKVL